jgi:hypothetical protein
MVKATLQARGKYQPSHLIPMFRKAAVFRNEMIEAGLTDNGGAIAAAERILDILGLRLCYPGLSNRASLRKYERAEFSKEAFIAHNAGKQVLIENVAPHRALTQLSIRKIIDEKFSDEKFAKFVKKKYRLLILTKEETIALNRLNRSQLHSKRVAHIKLATRPRRSR